MLKTLIAQLLSQQAALAALAADPQSPNRAHAAAMAEPVSGLLTQLRGTVEGSAKAELLALTVPAVTLTLEKLLAQDAARKANNPVAALMAGIEAGQAVNALGSMVGAMTSMLPPKAVIKDLPALATSLATLRQQQQALQDLADTQGTVQSFKARLALPILQEFIALHEKTLQLPESERSVSDGTLRRHAQRMVEMNIKFLAEQNEAAPEKAAPKAEHPEIIKDLLKAFPGATVQRVEGRAAEDMLATLQSGERVPKEFCCLGVLHEQAAAEGLDAAKQKALKKAAKAERKAAQQAAMSPEALAEQAEMKALKTQRNAEEAEQYASLSKSEKREHQAIKLLAKSAARNSPFEWREIANMILATLGSTQTDSDE